MCKTIFVFIIFNIVQSASAQSCTYETWDWSTVQKKSVNHQKVVKPKSALTADERGPIPNCSVCEEDQIEVTIPGIPKFKICRAYEAKIVVAVRAAQTAGYPFHSIVAYRVGKSKGAPDQSGLRTQFSNHSYGTAVDFNSEINGLYENCDQFGLGCKLLRGGEYHQGTPGAIDSSSALYKAMIGAGFKWGGELKGRQKDFMHFSLTGM